MHIVRFCKYTKTISICKLFYKRTYHLDFYCSFSYQSTPQTDTTTNNCAKMSPRAFWHSFRNVRGERCSSAASKQPLRYKQLKA